jgi:hypothetical protein
MTENLNTSLAALVIYLAEYLHDIKDKLTYKQ